MATAALPEWAARYVGIPYRPGGRDLSGIDCWGLFALIWEREFGRALPSYDGPLWSPGATAEEVARSAEDYASRFDPVPAGEERCGDGILFRMRGHPLHLALVVTPGWMLHVDGSTESCIESYRSFRWAKRVLDFYRFA